MNKNILGVLLVVLILSVMNSCKSDQSAEADIAERTMEETSKIESVPDATSEFIDYKSLTDDQKIKVNKIHTTLKEVNPASLEDMVKNFSRGDDADHEIYQWMAIANTFEIFATRNPGDEAFKKRSEGFRLLLMLTMMPEEQAVPGANLKILTEEETIKLVDEHKDQASMINKANMANAPEAN